jgi:hypothetical protein
VEHVLFCKSLKGNATGREVIEIINDFFNEQKNQVAVVLSYMYRWQSSHDGHTFRLDFMGEKRK